MISISEHIDELRAELRGCLCPHERVEIAADLEATIATLKDQDRAAEADRPPG
jgi:hypothetical protein